MMPKLTRTSSPHRYPTSQLAMPVTLGPGSSALSYYSSTRPYSAYYDVASSVAQASLSLPSYDPYAVAPLMGPSSVGGPVGAPSLPSQHRSSSVAWTSLDDQTLIQARASGQNWNQIQAMYFPGKTGNACRKRHERLMERRGADDWDTRKLERLSNEYMSMRREIWQPLAQRCGEKWNVVEQKCMSHGLKNIQSHARAGARRARLESGLPPTAYHDDSRISGLDLDVDDMADDTYSSPDTTSSTAGGGASGGSSSSSRSSSSSSTVSSQTGAYDAAPHSTPGSYPGYGYGAAPQHHSYTPSLSSQGAAGYGGAHHTASQPSSPYMGRGTRLPSVGDMGIDAIINRAPAASGIGTGP